MLRGGGTGRRISQIFLQPLAYGVICGSGFGIYENICYPLKTNRPKNMSIQKNN